MAGYEENIYSPKMANQLAAMAGTARPSSAKASRPGTATTVHMYQNDLFETGDVLSGPEPRSISTRMHMDGSEGGSASSPRVAQQRSAAAQKKFERLNLGGTALNNSSSGGGSSSRPTTPGSATARSAAAAAANGSVFRGSSSGGGIGRSGSVSYAASPSGLGSTAHPWSDSEADSPMASRGPSVAFGSTGLRSTSTTTGGYDPVAVEPAGRPQDAELDRHGSDIPVEQLGDNGQLATTGGSRPAGSAWQRSVQPKMDLSDMRAFLMSPGPRGRPVMCYIERDKGSTKMYPKYMLYLDSEKRFVLSARKRKMNRSSNYCLSLDMEDSEPTTRNYFGKLRANFVGTEFTVYDNGCKPGEQASSDNKNLRKELAAVTYDYNVLGTRGPRRMTAAIPRLTATGASTFRARDEGDSMSARLKSEKPNDDLVIMRNKSPRWNNELSAYCLNFNGRVTEASVKNFQLVSDDEPETVILQFGKVSRDIFTMDFQWPMTAVQAVGICLSSFDNKLGCE